MTTMLHKLWDRIIYRDPRFYAAFPSVATLADGSVVVAFRRARDHRWLHGHRPPAGHEDFGSVDHLDVRSHLALQRLSDDMEPLGEPSMLPPDPEAADQDASLLVLRDGRLIVAGFCWYPVSAAHVGTLRAMGVGLAGSPERTGCQFIFWGGYTRVSADGGRSWSPHRFLPVVPDLPDLVPELRPYLGGPVRGRMVEASDGTIHLASYAVRPEGGRHVALHHASTDGGDSWTYRGVIAEDKDGAAGFCEPALQCLADGRLVAFHRTFGLEDRLATSISHDGGRSWERWTVHGVVGHPTDACALPDGRVLLVYGYRHAPYGVRARLWNPERQSIDETEEFIIRDDAPSPDVGYPWASVTPDGRILVVYYIADGRGIRNVEASLLALTP